jgi:hypothetical protein
VPSPSSGIAARSVIRVTLAALLVAGCGAASAWVYPEHRDLSVLAVQQLDATRRATFDQLWADARAGGEQRLCTQGADTGQALAPACLDWAALAAIAGDHSCSSREMIEVARAADWILEVADIAARLKADLARIPVTAPAQAVAGESMEGVAAEARRRLASESARAERINALRLADNRLQRADPDYATRAGSSFAHFLLARPTTGMSLDAYAELALQRGSPINAVGVYSSFHLSALQKASRLAREPLAPEQRHSLALAALADEAFAAHFLQDVYASGHIAGTWGDSAQRQGTHDFYNQNGLEVFTWKGGERSLVLMGDAHMRREDAEVAAAAVLKSLAQVLDVAGGRGDGARFPHTPLAPAEPDAFDVCVNHVLPGRAPGLGTQPAHRPYFEATLADTPVPGLGPGLGAMPRFRSEVGPFVGLAGSIDLRSVDGGFVSSQTDNGLVGGLDLSLRAGFGLDGVMGESGDGLVFASIGFRADSPSSNRYNNASQGALGGNLSAAIPARAALSTRLRMPFYLVPGDLLLLAPLYLIAPETYSKMAVVAGNGGLIPWQSGWATSFGRFQFVLGRELGVTYFGRTGDDQLLAPSLGPGDPARIVRFKSTLYDLPILEYRPYRAFANNQSSSVMVQLFAGANVPQGVTVDYPPGAPPPPTRTVWSVGLRLLFDWRRYP